MLDMVGDRYFSPDEFRIRKKRVIVDLPFITRPEATITDFNDSYIEKFDDLIKALINHYGINTPHIAPQDMRDCAIQYGQWGVAFKGAEGFKIGDKFPFLNDWHLETGQRFDGYCHDKSFDGVVEYMLNKRFPNQLFLGDNDALLSIDHPFYKVMRKAMLEFLEWGPAAKATGDQSAFERAWQAASFSLPSGPLGCYVIANGSDEFPDEVASRLIGNLMGGVERFSIISSLWTLKDRQTMEESYNASYDVDEKDCDSLNEDYLVLTRNDKLAKNARHLGMCVIDQDLTAINWQNTHDVREKFYNRVVCALYDFLGVRGELGAFGFYQREGHFRGSPKLQAM